MLYFICFILYVYKKGYDIIIKLSKASPQSKKNYLIVRIFLNEKQKHKLTFFYGKNISHFTICNNKHFLGNIKCVTR